jgi:hypothetical protein
MADLFWMGSNTPKGENHYKWWRIVMAKLFERFDDFDINKTERAQIRAVEDLEILFKEARRKRMGAQLLVRTALELSISKPSSRYYPKKRTPLTAPANSRERGNQSRNYLANRK